MKITKDELNIKRISDIDQELLDSVIRSCNFILSLYEGLPSIEKNNRLVSYGIKDLDSLTFSKKSDESCHDKETVALKGLLIFFIERLSLYRRVLFLRFDDYRKNLFQCESPSKDIISVF